MQISKKSKIHQPNQGQQPWQSNSLDYSFACQANEISQLLDTLYIGGNGLFNHPRASLPHGCHSVLEPEKHHHGWPLDAAEALGTGLT